MLAFGSGGRFSVAGLGPCALGEFGPFVRDRPEIAFLRLAGMRVSEWGQMPHRRMVRTILTSVTAHTLGCQLSRLAQSPFLERGRTTLAQFGGRGVCPVTMSHGRWSRRRRSREYASAGGLS